MRSWAVSSLTRRSRPLRLLEAKIDEFQNLGQICKSQTSDSAQTMQEILGEGGGREVGDADYNS
jgi:hypothetical protein